MMNSQELFCGYALHSLSLVRGAKLLAYQLNADSLFIQLDLEVPEILTHVHSLLPANYISLPPDEDPYNSQVILSFYFPQEDNYTPALQHELSNVITPLPGLLPTYQICLN